MSAFDFYTDLMDENRTVVQYKQEDKTFVLDLTALRQQINEKEIDQIEEAAHL